MRIALASLTEGTGAISISLLFVIGFNPSNIYWLLCGAPMYGESSICPQLGYWIRYFIQLLVSVRFFLLTSTSSYTL